MIKWISRKSRQQKRQAEHEAALKQSLADKVQRFQASSGSKNSRYTEVKIKGKVLRVQKEHITIQAVSPITYGTLA